MARRKKTDADVVNIYSRHATTNAEKVVVNANGESVINTIKRNVVAAPMPDGLSPEQKADIKAMVDNIAELVLLANKFNVVSGKELDDNQLVQFDDWLNRQPAKSKPKALSVYQQREQALQAWLEQMQQNDPDLDIRALPFTQRDIHQMLAHSTQHNTRLFKNISDSTFAGFWKQQLCACGRGLRGYSH